MVIFFSRISSSGRFFAFTGTFSIASSVESAPSMTLPKIVYFPSRLDCFAYVMKNWGQSHEICSAHLRLVRIRSSVGHRDYSPSIELESVYGTD